MTKANTQVIAKVAAVVAGLGLVLSSFAIAMPAAAQTTTFTRDLTIGSTGADVTALQNWLISEGYSIPAGATGYFGTQTQAAVAAYQAANSITPAAGYFGPITRAKVNAGEDAGGDDDGDDDDDDDNGELEGGEADLSGFDINDEESEGAEGAEEVEVFTVEFDVDDADVEVQRMEIMASSTNSALEDRPWDFFETVYVWDADGDELASMDVDSRDDWDEEDGQGEDIHRLVLSGLDYIVREGDTAELTVGFDIASNIDTADLAQDFDFYIPDDGIRARDGEGIDHYIPNGDSSEVTFGFEEEETGDLDINSSSDDPDNLTIISDEDDDVEFDDPVFVFDLENNDDVDVLVTDITIDVATTGMTISNLVSDITLVIDGEETDGDINNDGTIDFEDIDYVLSGDDEVAVEIFIEVAEDANGTVQFSIDRDDIEAESDENGDESDVSGSANGETHTISLSGVSVAGVSDESDVNDDNTIGTFELVFEVTAEGDEDIYIYSGAEQGANTATPFNGAASTTGFAYNIYNGSNSVLAATTSDSALVQSSADSEEDDDGVTYYIVEAGETEEFTLTVTLDPAAGTATAQYFVELDAILFGDEEDQDTADDTTHIVPNDSEFETSAETIAASAS